MHNYSAFCFFRHIWREVRQEIGRCSVLVFHISGSCSVLLMFWWKPNCGKHELLNTMYRVKWSCFPSYCGVFLSETDSALLLHDIVSGSYFHCLLKHCFIVKCEDGIEMRFTEAMNKYAANFKDPKLMEKCPKWTKISLNMCLYNIINFSQVVTEDERNDVRPTYCLNYESL